MEEQDLHLLQCAVKERPGPPPAQGEAWSPFAKEALYESLSFPCNDGKLVLSI